MRLTKLYFKNANEFIQPLYKRYFNLSSWFFPFVPGIVLVSMFFALAISLYWIFIIIVPTWSIFVLVDFLIFCPGIPRLLDRFFGYLLICIKIVFSILCKPITLVFSTLLDIATDSDLEK